MFSAGSCLGTGGSGTAVTATSGRTVLIALIMGSSVSNTVGGDSIGLLASNIVVGGLGQTNMQFGTQFDVIDGSYLGFLFSACP